MFNIEKLLEIRDSDQAFIDAQRLEQAVQKRMF
jgi:hypothetical protein